MRATIVSCGVGIVLATVLAGCPPPETPPPFNTTGMYAGSYEVMDSKQFGPMECDMTLELAQLVDVPRIANTFAGIATLEWDCIVPAVVQTQLGIESEALLAPVLATLNEDGSFSLDLEFNLDEIPSQLLALLDTAGIEDIPLQNFSVTFSGTGTDSDLDGAMDACEGSLTVHAEYEADGTQTIDLGGTFEAIAVAP